MRYARSTAVVIGLICVGVLGGCGSGLSGSSTCKEFMAASSDEQYRVVSELAQKYRKPNYATPLGRPAVPYYCAARPNTTLDEFFDRASG